MYIIILNLLKTAKSPILAHLNASLQGLITIRAFESEQIITTEFDKLQASKIHFEFLF